jgi:hypothetical protein
MKLPLKIVKLKAWAILDANGDLVNWKCLSDGEEGLEVHRTRRLARGGCFKTERVVPVTIAWNARDTEARLFEDTVTTTKPTRRRAKSLLAEKRKKVASGR